MEYPTSDADRELTPIGLLEERRDAFRKAFGFFAGFYKVATSDFRINRDNIDKISNRIYQRLNYYQSFHGGQLAQVHLAGLKAYWVLRYRPITLISSGSWKKAYDVNVYFAFFVILCEVLDDCLGGCQKDAKYSIVNNLLADYENTFIRSFSEYDISKEAMMLVADNIKKMCLYEVKLHTPHHSANKEVSP